MSVDDAPMSLAVPEERVDPPAVGQPIGGGEDDKIWRLIRIKWAVEQEH